MALCNRQYPTALRETHGARFRSTYHQNSDGQTERSVMDNIFVHVMVAVAILATGVAAGRMVSGRSATRRVDVPDVVRYICSKPPGKVYLEDSEYREFVEYIDNRELLIIETDDGKGIVFGIHRVYPLGDGK